MDESTDIPKTMAIPPAAPQLLETSKQPAWKERSAIMMAVLTLVGAIAGGVTGELVDYFKVQRMRAADARIKAIEIGWSQSLDTFQRLFALRARMRADIGSYRESEIRAAYFSGAFRRDRDPQHLEREMYYRRLTDEYTNRVIDDRAQLQSLLGWFEYVLPDDDNPIRQPGRALVDLELWYPPKVPSDGRELDAWMEDELAKANDSIRVEINGKFDAVQSVLKKNRDRILMAPARQYIRQMEFRG